MVSKNNIQHKMEDDAKRVPHYGLRKLGIGVASVLLGTTLYFGNAQAVRADATNNVGTSETETEKQTTTPNMSNGTKVTLSDGSKVTNPSTNASNETSESNNGNTDQSDITTTKSNNESTQNSIGKVQDNGQKSENSITQTIDTDNVNNASQAVPYLKLFVNNKTGTNDNPISTVTQKSTDGRYSLTFKSYGVIGQNGSTVPDSAFIDGKITFPLLLHGNVKKGDTVVITIPYADTYTVNAQSLSSQDGTQSIISGSNTSDWIIKYSFSRSATITPEIDIEGSNNGYELKNHPLSDPAGDTKKTIKWFENGTEQDNTDLNFISRQMPSWNPDQQLDSPTLIDGKQLLNSNVVYSYSVREDNGTVPSQAGNPNWPSAQINNTLNYGTTITIPMPEGFVLDVNATNKLVPGFYGDNKQAEIKQEGNNIIITVPSGKGAQGFELKPGYQFVGHYDIKNPETTSFTRTATDRISIVENLTADGKQQKKFTSDKPFSENFWGTSDKVPITNVSTWVNSAWKSKTWNSNGQGELIQWKDDHDQIIAYAGLQNGYSANLNNAQITLNIPDGMIVHGVRVPSISGATSYTYQYTLDDGTVHSGTVMPGDKIEVNDLSRTITSITLTPDVIDSNSGTGTFDGSSNYFNEGMAVSKEMPQNFEIYGHVGKTKRDGKTIVKNGEVWQLGVQLSAVSNGYVYKFSNSENILVLVPSQRQSSSLSSLVANWGSTSVTIDSNKIDSTQTNLVIRTYYDSSKLSLMASTTAHIDNAILYIKLPKGITYKGVDKDSYAAVKNAKLSVFQDDEDNTIVKIDYTGSYLDITKTINMLLGFSSDVMQGTYKVKTILYSPVEDLMPWTKYFPQNNGKTYSPTSDEQKWLPSDTSNLYLIDIGPATIIVTRAISGLNTISLAKGNKDLADNSSNGTSSTTGDGSMHFAVSINNGSTNAISNAQTIINLPSKSNGSGFDFHLNGANSVTYSGSTPLTFKYSTSSFNFTNGEDTEGYQPNTSSFVTADKVTDWSSIKSILVEIPSLPASSIIGRINIDGIDSTIMTDGGKTGYLGTGLYMAGYKPYVELQSAKIDVLAKKTVTYQFIDDDGNGSNVGKPVQVTGDVDSEQPVNGLTLPTGYKLTKGGTLPTSVKIGNYNQTIDIHLSHVITNVDHTKPVDKNGTTVTDKVIDGAHEDDLNQTITRTINITKPGQKTQRTTQTAKIFRDATVDEVTGKVTYGVWSTDDTDWTQVDVPSLPGYTTHQSDDQTGIPAVTVKDGQKNVTIDVTYTANVQTGKIIYQDADDSNVEVGHTDLSGKTDEPVTITPQIPAGYDQVAGQNIPASEVATADGIPKVTVKVSHHKVTVNPGDEPNPGDKKPGNPNKKPGDGTPNKDITYEDLHKSTTRTITIHDPHNGDSVDRETINFNRIATIDDVTGDVTYGAWTPVDSTKTGFTKFDVPSVDGYTSKITTGTADELNAQKPTQDQIANLQDENVVIDYTANAQKQIINYVDNQGNLIAKGKVDGVTDQTVDIKPQAPEHYTIVPGQNIPENVTLTTNNTPITVKVTPKLDPITDPELLNKTIIRTITINKPNAKPQVVTQKAMFTRTGTTNEVTGKQNFSDWTLASNAWTKVDAPLVPGYTPDKSKVDAVNVTPDMNNASETINYLAKTQTGEIVYVDVNNKNVEVSHTDLTGKTDEPVTITPQIPAGYDQVAGQNIPASEVATADGIPKVTVKVSHHKVTVNPGDEPNPGDKKPGNPNKKPGDGTPNKDITYEDLHKSTTRTITIHDPHNGDSVDRETINFNRIATIDDVTGDVTYGAWTPVDSTKTGFTKFDVPSVDGYTSKITTGTADELNAQKPTQDQIANLQDENVVIDYTANAQKQIINYVDNQGNLIAKGKVDGVTDQTVDIKPQAPEHYTIVPGQNIPENVTLKTTNPAINIQVTSKMDPVTDPRQLTKTISRTITINVPNEEPQVINQTASFTRTGETNEVTGETTYTDWKPESNGLEAVNVPAVPGYTPSQKTVASVDNPTANTKLNDVTVNYSADDQTQKIDYVDPNGKVVKTDTIKGKTDETVKVTPSVPDHYELVPGQEIPGEVKITDDNPVITVKVTPKLDPVTDPSQLTKTITRTINVTNPDGQKVTNKQVATFTRTGETNEVTGETTFTNWKMTDNGWTKYTIPAIKGYTPNVKDVPAVNVTPDMKDTEVNVTYTANESSQVINYVDPDGNVVKTDKVPGKTDETVKITPNVPGHYELVPGQDIPGEVKITGDNPAITVNVTPRMDPVTDPAKLTKTISRMITINKPGEKPQVINQTATFKRTGKTNEVTGITTYTPWVLDQNGLTTVSAPEVPGYTPNQKTVDAIDNPTVNTKLNDVNITYTANDQTTHINYVDPQGNTVKRDTVSGKTDQTVKTNSEVPAGWKITDGQIPETIHFTGEETPDTTITIDHATTSIDHNHPVKPGDKTPSGKVIDGAHDKDLNKTITRTINITKPGQKTQTVTQTAKIYRDATVDDVTGEVTYGAWSTDDTDWSSVDVPAVPGYTVHQSDGQTGIPAVTVTDDQKDVTINVTYTANDQTTHINYVDENGNVVKTETVTGKLGDQITLTIPAGYHFKDGETPNLVITESGVQIVNVVKDRQVTPGNPTINDHDKKNGNNSAVDNNGASQDNNGKKVSTSSTGQSNNANNHKQSQLPQTGNESRNGFSAAGFALASLTSLIGLAGFKKKRD